MATASVRSELSCSVCREIYTDPVTLPCGHNFCLRCIERTWEEQRNYLGEVPSCPECRQRYGKKPELNRNVTLRNIAEKFLPTHPEQECYGIFCTYCDSPVAAAKSCLMCEASLCDYHVEKHSKSAEHVFTKPTTYFEGRKCSVHKKILEFFCTKDGACICVCCLVGEHRGHGVELLSEVSEKKKEKLRKVLEKLSTERKKTEGQIQRLQKHRNKMPEKSASETERVTALFRDIREQLEALEKQVQSDISREQEKVSLKIHDLIQQLEIKKEELSKNINHIEELCNMADPLTVLQEPDFHWAAGADTEGRVEDDIEGADTESRTRHTINALCLEDLDVVVMSDTLLKGLADIVEGVNTRVFTRDRFIRHVGSKLAEIGNELGEKIYLNRGFPRALFRVGFT